MKVIKICFLYSMLPHVLCFIRQYSSRGDSSLKKNDKTNLNTLKEKYTRENRVSLKETTDYGTIEQAVSSFLNKLRDLNINMNDTGTSIHSTNGKMDNQEQLAVNIEPTSFMASDSKSKVIDKYRRCNQLQDATSCQHVHFHLNNTKSQKWTICQFCNLYFVLLIAFLILLTYCFLYYYEVGVRFKRIEEPNEELMTYSESERLLLSSEKSSVA